MKLTDLFEVSSEFTRSINVNSDLTNLSVAAQYVWTDSNRTTVERIITELASERRAAITLTGPFGTGKSSLLLQLLHLFNLGGPQSAAKAQRRFEDAGGNVEALKKVTTKRPPLPVIITARPAPIQQLILEGVQAALTQHGVKGVKTKRRIGQLLETGRGSIRAVFEALGEDIDGSFQGAFVIIDEFGKLLEYAAINQAESDLFTLQELAELRSIGESGNYLLLTVLHQAFEGYARYVSKQKQNEWTKIQGRFTTLNVAERPEELVPLIAKAITARHAPTGEGASLIRANRQQAWSAFERCGDATTTLVPDLKAIVGAAYPFNPLALLALPFLSKTYGQNSRSSFTFLGSNDPHSFQDFLDHAAVSRDSVPEVTLAHLYDYFSQAGFHTTGPASHRWNLVNVALTNVGDAMPLKTAVLKCIGVLNILQLPRFFRADDETLRAALHAFPDIKHELGKVLAELVHENRIVYRKFAKEYRIWEGSDFNFEEEVAKRESLPLSMERVIALLNRLAPLDHQIARKHYEETGTMRYYKVAYVPLTSLRADGAKRLTDSALNEDGAEGLILLPLLLNADEHDEMLKVIAGFASLPSVITIAIEPRFGLIDLLREILILEDIARNNSALASDAVARKEIRNRIVEAEDRVVREVQEAYWNFGNGQRIFAGAKNVAIRTRRAFHELLSQTFTQVFSKAPAFSNELLNRHMIPGTITLAVKGVIDQMLTDPTAENLGFAKDDFSASASIYRLFYKKTGIHSKRGQVFGIGRPTASAWGRIWDHLLEFLASHTARDLQVEEIYDHFAAPPYGIRRPVMAMFFFAYLESPENTVSLYDEGTYTPKRDFQVYEMLLRRPNLFMVRRASEQQQRTPVLQALTLALHIEDEVRSASDRLFAVAKAFYRIFRALPQITLQTKRLAPLTLAFRDMLARTNRPEDLINQDLPELFKVDLTSGDQKQQTRAANEIAQQVVYQLDLLAGYQKQVTAECTETIKEVFQVDCRGRGPLGSLRRKLSDRAQHIFAIAKDIAVQNFILRATNSQPGDEEWLAVVIGNIAGKKIDAWHDGDIEDFSNKCRRLFFTFNEYEKLLLTMNLNKAVAGTRLTVTSSSGQHFDQWIEADLQTPPTDLRAKLSEVTDALKAMPATDRTAVLLLALKEATTLKEAIA